MIFACVFKLQCRECIVVRLYTCFKHLLKCKHFLCEWLIYIRNQALLQFTRNHSYSRRWNRKKDYLCLMYLFIMTSPKCLTKWQMKITYGLHVMYVTNPFGVDIFAFRYSTTNHITTLQILHYRICLFKKRYIVWQTTFFLNFWQKSCDWFLFKVVIFH